MSLTTISSSALSVELLQTSHLSTFGTKEGGGDPYVSFLLLSHASDAFACSLRAASFQLTLKQGV